MSGGQRHPVGPAAATLLATTLPAPLAMFHPVLWEGFPKGRGSLLAARSLVHIEAA